ncbi:TPA: hypothetical protein N0F65_011441 [Lagenidium giganteum]|uniref:Uncharacterized protein n=1 Tax=Lagenidium giganteum TaxID=4803 RepID=A0AAV2ZC44_9STRA|nr:TPA: hypothetical protein N0F65_011441 [Lagenidium giganteum]
MSFSASSSPPSSSATSSTSTCSPTLGHDAGAASLAEKAAATSTGDGNAPPKDDIAVKAEPLEAHDNGFWATIFAEGNEVMELLDEDGYASSLDDHVKELSPPLKAPSSEPTTTSAMLEQWNHCESELTLGQTAPLSSPSTTFALPSLYAS